jgi:hypothetical protein
VSEPTLAEHVENSKPLNERLGKIAELLERSGIDPADVGKVNRVTLGEYQGMYKDNEGNAHVVDLQRAGIVLSPKWAEGPEWPVVQPAEKVTIRALPPVRRSEDGWKTAVILPDPQIGFRKYDGEEPDPFHCERAMAAAIRMIRLARPDLIVNLGDTLDLAEFSRFEIEPAFAQTTQLAIDRTHLFLAEQRANAGWGCEIRLIEGNHDRRIQKAIVNNAKAAFGLRQAATPPTTWPVMSIPHLLRLEDLQVEYIDGYPAGITWINDRLACVHGERLKVSQVVDDERVSVIQGHIHRIAQQHKTRRVRDGARTTLAMSPGCLCRIDGSVPSTKGAVDSFGRAIRRPEDWQNGVAVVTYKDGDSPFHVELIPIHDGAFFFRGQYHPADAELPEA